jgi:hypothetical protein
MGPVAPGPPVSDGDELALATGVAMAAAHAQFQGFQLSRPSGDPRQRMGLGNPLVPTLLATHS